MAKFILPFEEYQRGWYEIEAETLEQAQAIVIAGDFTEDHDPQYKDGRVDWNEEDLTQVCSCEYCESPDKHNIYDEGLCQECYEECREENN
jgi:hypothetical protein